MMADLSEWKNLRAPVKKKLPMEPPLKSKPSAARDGKMVLVG